MVYRRKRTFKRKPMAFKKKRIFKTRRKKLIKRKAYNQNFECKAEVRVDMRGKSYASGTDGVRAAIYWGANTGNATNFPDAGHVMSPFNTYEWNFWHGKFEEFQIVGVKIKAQPGIQQGLPNQSFSVQQTMAMGTSPSEIESADNVTTNVLYQCNDFGTKTPDPSKCMSRYYGISKSERRKFRPIWKSTRVSEPYSNSVTYLNWEILDIGDNNNEDTKLVGKLYATYYLKFRRPRLDNVSPD